MNTSPLPAAAPASPRRQAAMRFIMATVLIDMVSIGLIIPVLPKLVGTFTHSASEQVAAYQWVAMAFGLANFIGAPILGALSDRFGRRPVLLMGFSGLCVSFFGTAVATQLWMLVAVRLFSGVMQGNVGVANAYVSDITAPEDRARRFGLLGAMFGIGFILGPILGGLLGAVSLRLPFYCAGVLAVCNWLNGYFVLPESLSPEHRQPFSWKKANPIGSLRHLTQLQGMGSLPLIVFLGSLAQFILQTTWALYTQLKFGWGPLQIGESLCTVGVMAAMVQGGLMGRLMKHLPPSRIAVIGLMSSSVSFLAWGLAPSGWMMYAVIALNLFGFAVDPALRAVVANVGDARTQGQTMGAVAGLASLAAVLATLVGPGLLQLVADSPAGDWHLGLPYYLCALLQATSVALAALHFARQRRQAAAPAAAGGAS